MASSSSDNSFSSATGTGSENTAVAPDGPSDSRCPICLERIRNVAFLNPCFHRFCFVCILEWSDRKAVCPLCKQRFHSFFHTIRSDTDFEEYTVPLQNASYGTGGERSATVEEPDNGILYEGYSGPHSPSRMRALEELMRHLGIRSSHPGGISLGQIREQVTTKFRRALYEAGVYVRNVQSGGFYRDISANFFHRNPIRLSRLVPWLRRELKVLCGSQSSLISNIQCIILSNITIIDLDSQEFADILYPHLLHYTDHFLHEFINFARSPFNIKAYDGRATYDIPFPIHNDGFYHPYSLGTLSPEDSDEEEEEEEEEEEGETEESFGDEEKDEESSTSTDEATWDEETLGSISLNSVDEFLLPFGSSDVEPPRSEDNMHVVFQAHTHFGAHSRHCPLHKCVFNLVEDGASMLCKSIPSCIENAQCSTENDDGEDSTEQKCLSHMLGDGTHNSRTRAVSNVGHLACSNQMLEPLHTPSQQEQTGSRNQTLWQEKDTVITKVIHLKGEEIAFIKMLQPKADDVFIIERIELKTRETDSPEQQMLQGVEMDSSAGLPSSTEDTPSGSANKLQAGCSSCISRP